MGGNMNISPDRLTRVVFESYYEFKNEENCSSLEAASMVISNVAKAMMESNLNKFIVLNCLLILAREENDKSFERRILTLIQETTSTLKTHEKEYIEEIIESSLAEFQKESSQGEVNF